MDLRARAAWLRTVLPVVLVVVVLASVGCSSDSDDGGSNGGSSDGTTEVPDDVELTGDFCVDAIAIQDQVGVISSLEGEAFDEAFARLAESVASVEPPPEIAEAWATFTSIYPGSSATGPPPDTATFGEAQDAIVTYLEDVCGVEIDEPTVGDDEGDAEG